MSSTTDVSLTEAEFNKLVESLVASFDMWPWIYFGAAGFHQKISTSDVISCNL